MLYSLGWPPSDKIPHAEHHTLIFFPWCLEAILYLYLTLTYINYYYIPAKHPRYGKRNIEMKVRVKRTSRGLKQSNRRTHRWLCPVDSTPTEPTVLTYSIIKFVCVSQKTTAGICPPLLLHGFQRLNSGPNLDKHLHLLSCLAAFPLLL